MQIQIDQHTMDRALERGATKNEIEEVLKTGISIPARGNCFCKYKIYEFNRRRLGKFFHQKRIDVIYLVEGEVLITVTVYVFYGKWEEDNENPI